MMIEFLGTNAQGHLFYYFSLAAVPLLFILLKGRRIRFVLPGVLMGLLIANPWFRDLWENKLGMPYFWRILWIVPVIPICAALPAAISEKTRNKNLKGIIAILCATVFALTGSYMYEQRYCEFEVPAPTAKKLRSAVTEVADYLLSIKENPRIIADLSISIYIRQYTGEIETIYGRNMQGYISGVDDVARGVYNALANEDGDMHYVAQVMMNRGYDYLVTDDANEERRIQLEENGFSLQHHIDDYGIYTVQGIPSEKWERNALGQVTSITTIDEQGNPAINEAGYSTISYEYDPYGYIIREFRTDTNGIGVSDNNGFAGYERILDKRGHVLMERTLDQEGNPISNNLKYAEVRREYKGDYISKEAYFNEIGEAVNRLDLMYAAIEIDRNKNGDILCERYYDQENKLSINASGYASVIRKYEGRNLVREAYLDLEGKPVSIQKGYASFSRTYDNQGHILCESYFDENNLPTNQINGYSREEREYEASNFLAVQRFYDSDNHPVVVSGYAEVHRTYDEEGHIIREEYFGADGQPLLQSAGYAAIEQEYNEEGRLISRRYLDSNGQPVVRTDGFQEARWIINEDSSVEEIHFFDKENNQIPITNINLAKDIQTGPNGWSQWMIPKPNQANYCFNIGTTNLGEKQENDIYTCQLEVEFRDVSATEGMPFRFWTQGSVDRSWTIGNVWRSNLIYFEAPMQDGIYSFAVSNAINGDMANASIFNIGFRCDYWATGMFRVRNVKIEKGDLATEWSPGI